MNDLIKQYIDIAKKRNPSEPEFLQTVEEVLTSLVPVLEKHPEYVESGLIERLIEPEKMVSFRVAWVDDNGKVHVNRGYRCQFNSAIGPYKGGLRFAPNVYSGIIKFLAFEQIFKNSLTGLPIGGGKGGSDFNPKGKSDLEIMRFCQSFMTELSRYIGANTDVPAGDQGVGSREIGYLFGQYKRIANRYEGVLTGKGLIYGGLTGRAEATGYGLVFFAREMLKANNEDVKGKEVVVSGYGNVSWGAVKKFDELGAKCITISGSEGFIHDPEGVVGEKIDYLLELREKGMKLSSYADKFKSATFYPGEKPWKIKADIYAPCATQNEITVEDAKVIVNNKAKYIVEGSNMSTTNEAIAYLLEQNVIIGPSKAANAGGVACSCIEMGQNSGHTVYTEEQVYEQLENIMVNIHDSCASASAKYGLGYNLIHGANIAGFEKVAAAMMAEGVL